jgi:hypothetical protein
MLKRPILGFAKPVADTVARAMAILQSRPDLIAKLEDLSLSDSNSSHKTT